MPSTEFVERRGAAESFTANHPGCRLASGDARRNRPFALLLLVLCLGAVRGAGADVLADCHALSADENDVHVCLDNFLDDLDDSMELVADQVNQAVDGIAAALFQRSQAAFMEYRRQNCLWYVSFSGPRAIAEQLGKNCLVDMTRDRLAELRGLLVANEQSSGRLQGYYVYGANLNSFIACGSGRRYQVESDNDAAGELQQRYLAQATTDHQLLYVDLRGELDDTAESPDGQAGIATISAVSAVRVPVESDCPLPSTPGVVTTVLAAGDEATAAQPAEAAAAAASDDTAGSPEDDEPEQQLNAYFGAWQAACVQRSSTYSCDLTVDLETPTGAPDAPVQLQLTRMPDAQTTVELRFEQVEIDSPKRIRWTIDDRALGVIEFSAVRVDETATRQIIADPDFLQRELLPALKQGSQVEVDVVAAPEDAAGERFSGTLMGLSRALRFADDFIDGAPG